MKFIYTIIFSVFLLSGFSQEMKIGFVDNDLTINEMEEILYFDSLQNVILKDNFKLKENTVDFYEKKIERAMDFFKYACYGSLQAEFMVKELESYEEHIVNMERNINALDSLYKEKVAYYLRSQLEQVVKEFIVESNLDIVMDKDVVLYSKDAIDITNDLMIVIHNRKGNDWKNTGFLEFVERLKYECNLYLIEMKELIKLMLKK